MHRNNSVIENETNGLNDPVRIHSDGLHISKHFLKSFQISIQKHRNFEGNGQIANSGNTVTGKI